MAEAKGNQAEEFYTRSRTFVPSGQTVPVTALSTDSEPTADATGQRQLSLSEVFIPHRPDSITEADYLILFIPHWTRAHPRPAPAPPITFIMPDTLRGASRVTPAGLYFNDLTVTTTTAFDSLGCLLVRLQRTIRLRRILDSLKDLMDSVNLTAKKDSAFGLGQAILDRLELLLTSPGCELVLSGWFQVLAADALATGTHYRAFVDSKLPVDDVSYWLVDGHLLVGTRADAAQPVHEASYLLIRIGRKSERQDIQQYIEEQRRKHALKRDELEGEGESESYFSQLQKVVDERNIKIATELYDHHNILPAVQILAIEAASDLAETVALERENGSETEFQAILNNLRDYYDTTFGVHIPGTRIRLNEGDLPAHSYIFILNDIPLILGKVAPDEGLCNATVAEVKKLNISASPAVHPGSGRECSWVKQADWDIARAAGYEIWDRAGYIGLHLTTFVKAHLREFLGLEELDSRLSDIPLELRNQIEAAPGGIARFGNVLSALLEEDLPIKPLATLARTYLTHVASPGYQITEKLRRIPEVQTHLLGDIVGRPLLHLAPDIAQTLQEHLVEDGDSAVLALEPELTQEILSAVRENVNQSNPEGVIMVHDGRHRPFLRTVIELEFPSVIVVAEDELAGWKPGQREPQSIITLE